MLKSASLQKGPEIRTGNTIGDADIPISEGTELNITTNDKYATACDDKNMSVELSFRRATTATQLTIRIGMSTIKTLPKSLKKDESSM